MIYKTILISTDETQKIEKAFSSENRESILTKTSDVAKLGSPIDREVIYISSTHIIYPIASMLLSPLASLKISLYRILLNDSDVKEILRRYALTEYFEKAVEELSDYIDVKMLASLLLWLEDICIRRGYKLKGFSLIRDVEYNEPLTIAVYLKGCDLNEWRALAKDVKQKIKEEGLNELAEKATIVCIDAFEEISRGSSLTSFSA